MSNKVFHDCLGREIKADDVLASGYRDGNRGHIGIGVVTGFKDNKILVTKYQRGDWHGYSDGSGRYWWPSDNGKCWLPMDGYWSYGERCFITGLTEDALKAMINLESEEKQ